MTPSEFGTKWSAAAVKESAGAKEHFIDLCHMLGYPTPTQADPTGEWYAFEQGAEKTEGGDGFADVWKRRQRYTPTSTFETFPFPRPTDQQRERIVAAAAELDRLRTGWLNPELLEPEQLELRTLTNLYNEGPIWLSDAHAPLDSAVFDAYGWPANLADAKVLEHLLDLNLARAVTPA